MKVRLTATLTGHMAILSRFQVGTPFLDLYKGVSLYNASSGTFPPSSQKHHCPQLGLADETKKKPFIFCRSYKPGTLDQGGIIDRPSLHSRKTKRWAKQQEAASSHVYAS
jgi:hypothetical protein